MLKRIITPALALAIYAALMAITWTIGSHQAKKDTEAQLDYAILDFHSTIGGAIDTMLGHIAKTAARTLKSPSPRSAAEMQALARELDIDEINAVSPDGEIVASTDLAFIGVQMAGDPVMNDFMRLTNSATASVSQPFRPNVRNPGMRAKYLGVPFPGGNGFVQVGMDEKHLSTMLPRILGYIFDQWLLGKTGFFLCADAETGLMISNPSRHRDEARTLAETGFDLDAAKPYENTDSSSAGKTFKQRLFGEPCYCRYYLFGGHRFIAALPEREFYGTRTAFVSILGVLFFLILTAFVLFIHRIERDAARLKAFYSEEDARRAKDLAIAFSIQSSALPAPLVDYQAFKLDAMMRPAREVGGDFYDFFLLDPTHLAFLVADVSGKGITAALYMMRAKTLIRDALFENHDPAAALSKVNTELCKNNDAQMFLTVWAAVLDLETGITTYANAGHNPPVILPEARFVTEKSGPVIAFLDGVEYKSKMTIIFPGDTIFLYTDGVTEALDTKNKLFGEERLIATLKAAGDVAPHSLCNIASAAIAAFTQGAPQADDMTMLAIRYIKPPRVFSRSFPPSQQGIADASDFLDESLQDLPALMPMSHIILDEICSNIVKHSGASGFEMDVEILSKPSGVKLTFIDDGVAYNPLLHLDPDTTLPAEMRSIGGLGIMMVKKIASSVAYNRTHNRNFLVITKFI